MSQTPQQPIIDLSNRTILVAGGAKSIGEGVSRQLARAGARVIIGDLDADAAEFLAAQLSDLGGDCVARPLDIASEESVAAFAAAASGSIDALINVASISSMLGRELRMQLHTLDMEIWQRTMDVNVAGFMRTMRAVLPGMLERGKGAIVNLTSIAAMAPQSYAPSYAMSKAAIIALTRHAAVSYGRKGVRCNAIAPGAVPPPVPEGGSLSPIAANIGRFTPLDRLGQPADIGAMAAFLASDAAGFVNGAVMHVDGGALSGAPWSAEVDYGTY